MVNFFSRIPKFQKEICLPSTKGSSGKQLHLLPSCCVQCCAVKEFAYVILD